MPEGNDAQVWEVVVGTLHDRGDPTDGAQESTLATGPEGEARRVFADTTGQAADRGYEYVRLRRGGEVVESWPQETGWTV